MSDGFIVIGEPIPEDRPFSFELTAEDIDALAAESDSLVTPLGGEVDKEEIEEDSVTNGVDEESLPDISEVGGFQFDPLLTKEQLKDPFFGYSREPLTPDHYKQFPRTVKTGPVKVVVYDLGTATGLMEYNRMLSDADPANSPLVIIVANAMKETADSWKVLVHYKEVWYKKTLK